MKRKQSGFKIMMRLIKLVKPLAFFMVLAVILGVTGFLCAIQITVLGSMTLLTAAGINGGLAIKTGCICIIILRFCVAFFTTASKRATTILHSSCLPLFVIKYSNRFAG